MATPVADSYSTSGGTIAAGRFAGKSGRIVVAGDSLTDWTPAFPWGLGILGYSSPVVYNAGIASNTIQDLINRWSSDVLAKNPAIVMLRIGTNSLSLSDSVFRSQYQTLLDSLEGNGIFGIVLAIPPRFDDTTHKAVGHNAWLASQCAAKPGKFVFVADSVDLGDANYDVIPAYFQEGANGVHMNGKGMYHQGIRQAAALQSVLTRVSPLITDGTDTYAQNPASNQWVSNPLMAGSGTPTDWTLSTGGSGTSASGSIVAADAGDANQTPWYRASIASFGAVDHTVTFNHYLTHPAVAADLNTVKRVDIAFECRFNSINGALAKSLNIDCRAGSSRIAPQFGMQFPEDEMVSRTITVRTALGRGEEGTTVDAYSANTLKLEIYLGARAAGTNVGSIDIRRVSARALGE